MTGNNYKLGWLVLVLGLAAAMMAPFGIAAEEQKTVEKTIVEQKDDSKSELPELQNITGQVVNLHLFLTHGTQPAYSGEKPAAKDDRTAAEQTFGTLVTEVPIALWTASEEESANGKLVPGRPVHVIFFDPENEQSHEAYKKARSLMGQQVILTGRYYDRDGLKGILVEGVREHDPANPEPVKSKEAPAEQPEARD